jgi:hypothetical protein
MVTVNIEISNKNAWLLVDPAFGGMVDVGAEALGVALGVKR